MTSSDEQPIEVEKFESADDVSFHVDGEQGPSQPRPGNGLAVTALLLPIVAGVLQPFLLPSNGSVLLVSVAVVVSTAILLAADVSRLRQWDKVRGRSSSPELTFTGVLLLWIVFFPVAFFDRRKFGCPNLGPASIGSIVASLLLPFVVLKLQGPQLPACDNPEIIQLVEQLARSEFVGSQVGDSIAHREVRFDAENQVRHGTCVVRIDSKPISIPYRITWQDSSQQMCVVNLAVLPNCRSPQVSAAIGPYIREGLAGFEVNSIFDFREIEFDEQQKCRFGVCLAQTDSAEIPVPFIVRWQDESRSLFQVRAFILPSPADKSVAELIQRIVDQSKSAAEVTSIDSFRELYSDWPGGRRFGACVVHSGSEQQELRFVVRWDDMRQGSIAVELLSDDSI
ncbi:MAG: hypothetical protein ACKO2L_02585 [Planctomycetaceae bacterium]